MRDNGWIQVLAGGEAAWQAELLFRIVLACLLGCLIGCERRSRDKNAGMRTHAIVAMGAALIMIVSKYGFRDIPDYDASRVAAQIVSGVGFLGAGIIFVRNNSVSGLTTAAGIWTTAGVGMAAGAGTYFMAVSAAALIVATQIALHRVAFLAAEPMRASLKLTAERYEEIMEELQSDFEREKIRLVSFRVHKEKKKETAKIEFDLVYPPGYEKNRMITRWSMDGRITDISG